ncbi:MAG: putative metalloprotease CJM1_0395 family protein [Gammaproteobacteria bacterium]|nr:putative metalloprotease CJM1_0395 family protein [Gammaproteobacteria bacterium]
MDIAPTNSGLHSASLNLRQAVGGVGKGVPGERVPDERVLGERGVGKEEDSTAPQNTRKEGPSAPQNTQQESPSGPRNNQKEESEQATKQRELREIQKLAKRDREVRAHEQAHSSVGGSYSGSPSYQYQRGSNGVSYAVGGHVSIDVSSVPGDPAATLQKMMTVRRAALAPQNPSPQDRAVAAGASQKAADARLELAELRLEESYGQPQDQPDRGRVVDVSV